MVTLTHVLRFYRTEVRCLASWTPKPDQHWRRRLALTYAVSVWSMIGFVAFMQWRNKEPMGSPKPDSESLMDIEEEPSEGRKQKFVFSSSIQYKENSIPYTERLYQYFTSSNKTSDSGSTEN
ncbi:small integral membrane protein 26 [Hyla sarda]|uniref:small integral membrane protein 26 n=1 Tax=Hyla sarda TaxID=327740 RepID=UPI0024C373CB|nr:small integral membrane protein 26 [Hyla sarda]